MKLVGRRVVGLLLRLIAPNWGWCARCWMSWVAVEGHGTYYDEGGLLLDGKHVEGGSWSRGCSPLCERCWAELTPAQRLPYYRKLFEGWTYKGDDPDGQWAMIERAVLAGR